MAGLLSWLGNAASDVGNALTGAEHAVFGGGDTPATQSIQNANQQLQQQQPKYGVLANPQVRQQFIQSNNTGNNFSPFTSGINVLGNLNNTVGNYLGNSVFRPAATGFTNTARLLPQASAFGADTLRAAFNPNSQADQNLANDATRLSNTYHSSIPGGIIDTALKAGNAINATPLSSTYGAQQALQARIDQANQSLDTTSTQAMKQIQQGVQNGQIDRAQAAQAISQIGQNNTLPGLVIQQQLQNKVQGAGFQMNDSPFTIGRKFVANAGQTVANFAGAGEALGAGEGESALARTLQRANESGKIMGVANTLGAIGQNNVTLKDLATAPVTGYLQGAGMAVVAHPFESVKAIGENIPIKPVSADFNPEVNKGAVGRDVNGVGGITPNNQRVIDGYSTPKKVTEYKAGEKVSNATVQGGTIDGTIIKTPDFSKDLRIKGNDFTVKLADGTTIKTSGTGFDAPTPVTQPIGVGKNVGPADQKLLSATASPVGSVVTNAGHSPHDLIAMAHAQKDEFLAHTQDIAAQHGGTVTDKTLSNAVKTDVQRIGQKINQRGGEAPTDILRTTIHHPDPSTIHQQIIDAYKSRGYDVYNHPVTGQPDVTNRYAEPGGGYKDVAIKLVKPGAPDHIVKEVQLISPEMARAKGEEQGHALYKVGRNPDANNPARINAISDKIYARALSAEMSRSNPSRVISLPSETSLSNGIGSPVKADTASTPVAPDLLSSKGAPSTSKNLGNLDNSAAVSGNRTVIPTTITDKTPVVKDNGTVRGFTESVQKSPNYTPELQKAVDNTSRYTPITDASAIANANEHIKAVGIDQMHQEALKALQSAKVITKQEMVNAGTVLDHLDSAGRTAEGQQLHELMASKGTAGGQQSQAFATILKRNPAGILHENMAKLNEHNIPITPDVQAKMNQLHQDIKNTDPNSIDRAKAVGQMDKYVGSKLPSNSGDKLFALWRSGLLTGARTLGKIVTSHGAHSIAEGLTNIAAAPLDRATSLISGMRSGALTAKGTGSGFAQGTKNAGYYLKTGIEVDPHTNIGEFRKGANFGVGKDGQRTWLDKATGGASSKVLNTYTSVGRLHGAIYQPFNAAFRQNELESLARAYAHNEGVPAAARDAYIKDFVAHPPSEAAAIAKQRGDVATFQQATALGNVASALQQKGGVLGKVIAPFTRIPSAIATDVFNYSPAGAVKTIVDGIKAARSDQGWSVQSQRDFTQGLGRSIVGGGAIAVGMALYNKGLINLGYPTDPKVQKLWQQEGRTPNSVLVGGKWRSLGSLGPAGAIAEMGGAIAGAMNSGDNALTATYKGLLHGAQAISEQSYLAGTNAAVNAIKDPGRYAGKLANQYAGSLIPTLISNTAQATDKVMRRVDNPLQAIQNNIPGLRQNLPAKVDSFGQPVPTPQGGNPLAAIDPFYSYNVRNANNPMINELQRLQNNGQGIMPTTVAKVETFGGTKVKLNPNQISQLQTLYGQAVQQGWQGLMTGPNYANMTDTQRNIQLHGIEKNAMDAAKAQYARQNADALNNQVAKPGTSINQTALDAKNKPYSPAIPKNPNAKPVVHSTSTAYDAKSNSWTQTNSKTGRVVTIAADGTRTVTNPGTRAPRASRSGMSSSRSRTGGAPRIPKVATIKTPRMRTFKVATAHISAPKIPKFGGIKTPRVATIRMPKIRTA